MSFLSALSVEFFLRSRGRRVVRVRMGSKVVGCVRKEVQKGQKRLKKQKKRHVEVKKFEKTLFCWLIFVY
jgi:hypothetical protein